MLSLAVLCLLSPVGACQSKSVVTSELGSASGLKSATKLLALLRREKVSVTCYMTWLRRQDEYRGRRAFWLVGRDHGDRVVFEIGFVRWLKSDPPSNVATTLINGGIFSSKLRSDNDYQLWNTISPSWARTGGNRWEIVVLGRHASKFADPAWAQKVFRLFGENLPSRKTFILQAHPAGADDSRPGSRRDDVSI